MANNRINKYIGAIVLGTALSAVSGCTDSWDDHYDGDGSASETTASLWDMIKDNPEYSRFADIVRKARYYKDNTHPVSNYSYEDILNGGQINTLWVPDNNALTQEEYQKWMQMLESGDMTDGYNVQHQFLGNHIALWRHNISEPGVDTVKMINGKNLYFDKSNMTFEKVPLAEYNIPTANGVMHVLKGVAPFRYNLYEYLKFGKPQYKVSQYVVGQDTTYFSANNSIEGLPDENGNPTYVDSVYLTSNMLFETRYYAREEQWQMAKEGFGARINKEDSAFVMLIPTDAAWDEAYAKLAASHKYASVYDDKYQNDGSEGSAITQKINVDSLTKMSIEMDLISPLVFNVHKQPKGIGEPLWTLEKFQKEKELLDDKTNSKKYMLNTFNDTLRAIGDWKPSDLFNVEPVEMSNGLAYEVSSWNFPSQFYTPDVEVEIESNGMFYNVGKQSANTGTAWGSNSKKYSFSNLTFKEITDVHGHVSNNNFFYLQKQSASKGPFVEIKLFGNSPTAYVPDAQVMSGKYDIQIVFVPYWYRDLAMEGKIEDYFYKFEETEIVNPEDESDVTTVRTKIGIDEEAIAQIASTGKYYFSAYVSYANGTSEKKKVSLAKNLTYNGLNVDTITVKENFEFPYSYKNMRYSYPTLILESTTTDKKTKEGYVFDIVIDKIILKRKD